MPDSPTRSRRRSLGEAISKARNAVSTSDLSRPDQQRLLVQLVILERISHIALPDWSHIHSLVTMLDFRFRDRGQAATEPLRAWALENKVQ